jgi:hypothetical protein
MLRRTREEARKTYRRMLDLHLEIYMDDYCDGEADEAIFWDLVNQEAEAVGQAENYRRVMEVA